MALAILLSIAFWGTWYMQSRIYIQSNFYDGENYEMADVTRYVNEGAEVIIRANINRGIILKTPPPITNAKALVLINKAMLRVDNMVLSEGDKPALKQFNSQKNLKYLETGAFDSTFFVHDYIVEFTGLSGIKIYLYPMIADENGDAFHKAGELINIAECYRLYHPCSSYLENLDLSFLSNPDQY